MPFVLDASIAACWAFEDEDHPVAAAALDDRRALPMDLARLAVAMRSSPEAIRRMRAPKRSRP
jgi:hypothetical protein